MHGSNDENDESQSFELPVELYHDANGWAAVCPLNRNIITRGATAEEAKAELGRIMQACWAQSSEAPTFPVDAAEGVWETADPPPLPAPATPPPFPEATAPQRWTPAYCDAEPTHHPVWSKVIWLSAGLVIIAAAITLSWHKRPQVEVANPATSELTTSASSSSETTPHEDQIAAWAKLAAAGDSQARDQLVRWAEKGRADALREYISTLWASRDQEHLTIPWEQHRALLIQAAKANNPQAKYLLGAEAEREHNDSQAASYMNEAANLGLADAHYWLAQHLTASATPDTIEEAIVHFQSAAQKGLDAATWELGDLYAKRNANSQDIAHAVEWWEEGLRRESKSAGKAIAPEKCLAIGMLLDTNAAFAKYKERASQWYQHAAFAGNAEAQYWMGKDANKRRADAESFGWFSQSAQQGHPAAEYEVGAGCLYGIGTGINSVAALSWLRKAAEHGNRDAQYSLGTLYKTGQAVAQDSTEAFRWFLKGAKNNNVMAMQEVAFAYEEGTGTVKNQREACKWYLAAAELGSAISYYALGVAYANGDGLATNGLLAEKWLLKARAAEMVPAAMQLYRLYSKGNTGVPKNNELAMKFLREAAALDVDEAQFELSDCLSNGWNVKRDMREAAIWWGKLAEKDYPTAQMKYGCKLLEAEDIPQDYRKGIKYLELAANAGIPLAEVILGDAYRLGKYGLSTDYRRAAQLFLSAAERGNEIGQQLLSRMYFEGLGTPKDIAKAKMWAERSAHQGYAMGQLGLILIYQILNDRWNCYRWLQIYLANPDATGKMASNARETEQLLLQVLSKSQIQSARESAASFKAQTEPVPPIPQRRNPAPDLHFNDQKAHHFRAFGSGFLIGSDLIATNEHVIHQAKTLSVAIYSALWGRRIYPVTVVATDTDSDLAILKIQSPAFGINLPSLPIASQNSGQLGDSVFTIGFPNIDIQGLEPKYSDGKISSISGLNDDVKYYQISVPVQPGNSGGPLVDDSGQVIGIVSGTLNERYMLRYKGTVAQNVNYAVKISQLRVLIESHHLLIESAPSPEAQNTLNKSGLIEKVKQATVIVIAE